MSIAMQTKVAGTTSATALFRKTSACRSLFGEIDHEEVRRDLNTQMENIYSQDEDRWNFNFRHETPLQGRYQWKEVTPEREEVPKPYQNILARLTATVVFERIASRDNNSETTTSQTISTQTDCACDTKSVKKTRTRRPRVNTERKLKQSKLSAFMKVTKRKRTDSECSSSMPAAKLLKFSAQDSTDSTGEPKHMPVASS